MRGTRRTTSRTSRPVKISDNPQESSEVSMARRATKATAPRGVLGTPASHSISRATGGELATTKPPMMIRAICMVKGIRTQKPSPKTCTSLRGFSPKTRPPRKTIMTAQSANTKASGK